MDARVHDRAGAAPAHPDDTAGDMVALVKEIQLAKARFGLPLDAPVRSCYEAGRDGILAPPVVDRAGRGERGGGLLEHRSQSARAPGEDGSAGCRQVIGPAPAVARRGTQGLECGARPVAGGRSAAAADAGDRDGARGSETRAQSDPGVAGDARHSAGAGRARSWRTWRRRRPATVARCRRRSACGSPTSGRTWRPSTPG